MPPGLLDSQLATLEPPGPDENVLVVNLAGTPEEEVAEVLHSIEERIGSQEEKSHERLRPRGRRGDAFLQAGAR